MRIKKHPLVCLHLMESVFRNCRVGDDPAQSPSLSRLNQQTMNLTETEEIVPNTQIPEDDGTQEAMTDTNQNEDVTETPNGVQSSSRRGRQPRRRSAIENVIENSTHFIMEYRERRGAILLYQDAIKALRRVDIPKRTPFWRAAVRCLNQSNYASAFVALEEEEKIDWLEAITGFNKDGERFNDYETGSGCNGFVGVSSGLQGRSPGYNNNYGVPSGGFSNNNPTSSNYEDTYVPNELNGCMTGGFRDLLGVENESMNID